MRKRINSMLMSIFLLLILLAFFINHSDNTTSYTVVGESHITSNTTWNASAGPYYIEGNVTVDFGWNLTIEAGVEIYFNGHHSIYVEGELFALGNSTDMITFATNISSQKWNRIQVNATGYALIEYCSITNATFGVCLNKSEGSVVQYNNISNNFIGIYLDISVNNTISNNKILYNEDKGLYLLESKNNTIRDNNVSFGGWIGIQLYTDSTENSLQGNNISKNVWSGLNLYQTYNNTIFDNDLINNNRGIQTFQSSENEIRFNRIISNFIDGIKLQQSHNNVMTNNNISYNGFTWDNYGIYITASNNNEIFHNTLIDNTNQSYDDRTTNNWDDGYPYGGNFWSDYIGVDLKKGKNQDVPGSDGIGDTNYTIESDIVDHYPLININRDIAPFLINLDFPLNNSFVNEGTEIQFDIIVKNTFEVNYSLNYGSNITIDPYNITASSSSGWVEGNNHIDVFVMDTNSNLNSSWFSLIFDSTKPIIKLISPSNDSVIDTKGIINISIIEPYISSAIFRLNNGSWENLLFPYDLNTSTWPEGNYWIDIHVDDLADNENSTYYVFTVDTTPPFIFLIYPLNNSYIKSGEEIKFTISDMHLDSSSIYYTVSGGGPTAFTIPYLIDTSTWDDGEYNIEVYAYDTLDHQSYRSYNITVDSTPPSVVFNSPLNNSVIRAGIPLNFSASDDNPFTFNYFINTGSMNILLPPYKINTTLFNDGFKILNVNLTDSAGNYYAFPFIFTIDSTDPEINLQYPLNGSTIRPGVIIEFDVRDSNIEFVNYSLNGGILSDLLSTMVIETIEWAPGPNTVEVFAVDKSGNNVTANFTFYVDNTPPYVTSSSPTQDKKGVSRDSAIRITFNELMDKTSFENAISIVPYVNFKINWNSDNLTLIITPIGNLSNVTTYTVTINVNVTDIAGNPLVSDFVLKFTTGPSEEFSIWMLFIIVVAAIIVIISLIMIVTRRRKKIADADEEEEGKEEFEDVRKEEGEEISEEKKEQVKEKEKEVSGEREEGTLKGEEQSKEKEEEESIEGEKE
jgi:parallel beta-helix repeat protein